MKKLLAFLGGTALAASVIPYAYRKDDETDVKTIQALLWKANIKSDPEDGKRVSVTFGFNNPFQSTETELFADDLTVNYHTAPVCCQDDCACKEDDASGCCGEACCCQESASQEDAPAEATEEAVEEEAAAPETDDAV